MAARNILQVTDASAAVSCTSLCSCYDEEDEPSQNIFSEVIDDDEGNEWYMEVRFKDNGPMEFEINPIYVCIQIILSAVR